MESETSWTLAIETERLILRPQQPTDFNFPPPPGARNHTFF